MTDIQKIEPLEFRPTFLTRQGYPPVIPKEDLLLFEANNLLNNLVELLYVLETNAPIYHSFGRENENMIFRCSP